MASSSSSSAHAFSNATNTIRLERAPIAKISLSTLVHSEQIDRAENVRNACIERENVTCTSGGMSPWKNFYITCSQASGIRHVVWKKGKPYHMDYLFFKTLDTGRLLPMQHAVIRVQFYIDKEKWERQSRNESSDNEDDWKRGNDAEMLHIMMLGMSEIMVLRSFIDVGGADIPIIVLNWCDEHLKATLEYWISMSAGKLSNVEATAKFSGIAYVAPHNLREPSLYEVDLLVRSLLQDPALEYVPPFILFFQTREMKFTPMFTSPHLIPPRQILSALPRGCGSPECTDSHCRDLTWDGLTPESLKYLDADMVKLDKKDPLFDTKAMEEKRFWRLKAQWEPREQLCNLWGCNVSYSAEDRTRLKRCVKCKEALYCSSTHQKLDWYQHKTVCEKRPDPY